MEQWLTAAWQRKAVWLWLFLPLTWLYQLISWVNKKAYDWGLKRVYYPRVPVLVIGNITVGGSGKTPFIIALVKYLQQKSIRVGVISRGYGGDTSQMPAIVTPQSRPSEVGDEPCLIVQSTIDSASNNRMGVPMAVCPNRGQAIDLLLERFPDTQLILADDGLQHYALDRDHNWIVVDSDRGFGTAQVLPVGFLREPVKRLVQPHTTVVFHQKNWQQAPSFLPKTIGNQLQQRGDITHLMRLVEQPLQPLFNPFDQQGNRQDSRQQAIETNAQLVPQTAIAMTGIGYPQRFFNSLKQLGFSLVEQPFNDHHDFSLADFAALPTDLPIVVTGKDAVKLRILLQQDSSELAKQLSARIWVLPVEASLSPQVYQALDKQLREFALLG